jgi:hypothetical protein
MAKDINAAIGASYSLYGNETFAGGIVGVDEFFTLEGEPPTSPATVTGFKGNGQR